MGRAFKWLGVVVLGLVMLMGSVYLVSRWMPVPEREATALAAVETPAPLPGRNGFAVLWSLTRDVDPARAEALLGEETLRLASMPAWHGEGPVTPHASVLEREPLLQPAQANAPAFCSADGAGCLDTVRADPAGYAALVEMRRVLTARVAALDGYDHFRNTLPAGMAAAIPAYAPLLNDLTVQAQVFASGDIDAALQGVCRDASLARKLVASGDSLIASMVGVALQKGSAALFVDMLAELPPDHPLPAACQRVFVADGAMVDGICPAMRAEGRWATESFRAMNHGQAARDLRARLFLDVEKTVARNAGRLDWFCAEEASALLEADRPLLRGAPLPSSVSLSCFANAAGCILSDIQTPAYADYGLRLQDAEMRQKAIGTWLWLRAKAGQDQRSLAERLAGRPDTLKSPARNIEVGADGTALQVRMYEQRPGHSDIWRLPVPGWMAGGSQ